MIHLGCQYCGTNAKVKYTVVSWNGCDIMVCKKCYCKLINRNYIVKRVGETVTHKTHNLKIASSNLAPATNGQALTWES